MAKIYSSPRALIVGRPKVTALHDEKSVQNEKQDPGAVNPRGLKTELIGRSARSRHSCSQLLAAITAPFEVGHFCATYPKVFPRSKEEIQLEKQALAQAGKRLGLFGIWTLEFQERGAPHWHMLLWERVPGAREKFCAWWRKHTDNQEAAAITVSQGDEAKASWYFNYHQNKENQTPPVAVGRWWGKIDGKVLEEWIQCEDIASTNMDSDVIWMKRLARRMNRVQYRDKVRRYLRLTDAQRKSVPDPRVTIKKYYRDGKENKRRPVLRCRKAKSSLGPQGFTWFIRQEHHVQILRWVVEVQRKPFVNPF